MESKNNSQNIKPHPTCGVYPPVGLENLSALVVCPDLGARNRLRSILRSFIYKGRLEYEQSLRGVIEILSQGSNRKFDMVFLASSLGPPAITELLQTFLATPEIEFPPVVVFLTDNLYERSSEIAGLYIQGVEGFVNEPYSVDEIVQLIKMVLIKKSNPALRATDQRKNKAIEFLLHDAKQNLNDLVRTVYSGGEPRGFALRSMRRIADTIRPFAVESPEIFAEIALKAFEKSLPATPAELQKKVRKPTKILVHPGTVVAKIMEQRGLSIERLLASSKLVPQIFTALLRCEHSLDSSLAKELARTLGMTHDDWMKIQTEYDKNKPKVAQSVAT